MRRLGSLPKRARSTILGFSVSLGIVLGTTTNADAQSPPAAPEKIALGDWQLQPTMEVRVRGEYRREPSDMGGLDFFGRLTPRVRDAWLVMERSRVGLSAERSSLRAQITLQDARALGSPSPSARFNQARELGRFGPYEAFLEMRSSGARPHYLRLGRQAVVWGEGRLIGNADFAPAGRSLDALRGHLAFGNLDFEALAVLLEAPSPLGNAFGDTSGPEVTGVQLYGLTAKWTIDPLLKVEAFGLARISRSRGSELDGSRFATSRLSGERVTAALRASGEARGWAYGAEGAYQFGNTASISLGGADIAAWGATAHVQKLVDQLVFTPTFRLAGSYASGDDGKGAYKQFDPLLADPQRFHGQMDLFAWSNMMDISGRVTTVPWTDTSLALEYRYARLAQERGEWVGGYLTAIGSTNIPPTVITSPTVPPVGTGSHDLGHELDLVFTYRPWLPLELRAGWSGLLLGDGAKDIMAAHARGKTEQNRITPADLAQYAYLQATLNVP